MKRIFSFSEKPVLFILNLLPSLIPGIDKAIAIYSDPETGSLSSEMISNENGEQRTESFHVSDSVQFLTRLRTDNAPYSWLRKEDLPFEITSKVKIQLEIFNELNNSILLLRVRNNFDNLNDLFFIYFNQELNNFGTLSTKRILSTDNKTIIANLLRNSILTLLQNQQGDKELFANLGENTRAMIREMNILKDEVEDTKEKYRDGLIRLSNSYLEDLSKARGVKYHLTEAAVRKIRDYPKDIGNLKPVIEQAAHYAEMMNLEGTANEVLISDIHLVFDSKTERVPKAVVTPTVSEVPAKYNKTFLLLDKLEHAALHVKSRNLLLTGANIGHEFPNPVTPPAITDALKKHKQKILFLFREFPDRWVIIRTEFRPVQNILNAKPFPEQLSA